MAMLPFCGYHMGDYFQHWLEVGSKLSNPPKIFNVNWFRQNAEGNFMWPGFGDNMRALMWILDRCNGKAGAVESAIGYMPKAEDLNIEGLDLDAETLNELLTIEKAHWEEETAGIDEFYAKFDRLPEELKSQLAALKERIAAL
jgi:phosphoenolpyruvate carboxykinase (GTP)